MKIIHRFLFLVLAVCTSIILKNVFDNCESILGMNKLDLFYSEEAFYTKFKDNHKGSESKIGTTKLISELEYIDESNELNKLVVSKNALNLYARTFYSTSYVINSSQELNDLMKKTAWRQYNWHETPHLSFYIMSYNISNSFWSEPILEYTKILNSQIFECDHIVDEKKLDLLDTKYNKNKKLKPLKSKKINIMFNKPVFVYMIGLCKSKINALEVLLPKMFFHFQNEVIRKCLMQNIPLNRISTKVFKDWPNVQKKMIEIGSLNFAILFNSAFFTSPKKIAISECGFIKVKIFNSKNKNGEKSLQFIFNCEK